MIYKIELLWVKPVLPGEDPEKIVMHETLDTIEGDSIYGVITVLNPTKRIIMGLINRFEWRDQGRRCNRYREAWFLDMTSISADRKHLNKLINNMFPGLIKNGGD